MIARFISNFIKQIRPIERGFEEHKISQVKYFFDIINHTRCGGGGQAQYGNIGKEPLHDAQKLVVGSEIMSIRRAAMNLVYDQPMEAFEFVHLLEFVHELF